MNFKSEKTHNRPRWYEYVGVMHIHSKDSDGTKSIPEIAKIGNELGLDFLFFTDHMTLKSLHLGREGWYGKSLAIIGYEIHDKDNKNHYLAFDIPEVLPGELSAQEYVKMVKEEGGFGIIAHPDEIRKAIPQFPSYPWTAWDAQGFDGIEIWNQMSEWMEKLTKINQLKMIISPRSALFSPTQRILGKWDELNKERKVVGVGGVDAHAHPIEIGPFKITIFPYKVQFQSIRSHILLDKPLSEDFQTARRQIFCALKNCNVFCSHFRWGDAKGFSFFAQSKTGIAKMGDEINLEDKVKFTVQTPRDAGISLFCDGELVKEAVGNRLDYQVKDKGNYRVEAFRKSSRCFAKKGWIFSNHIRVV
jgi:hypothetical protein